MIDSDKKAVPEISRRLAISQFDKTSDESMSSLIAWLSDAENKNLLTHEKIQEIFSAELKERLGYDS